MMNEPTKLLTIGGSDSGGAAGVQADLKTWTVLGAYGMSAISAVTAQNSVSVNGVAWIAPNVVAQQIDAVLSDYGAAAVKTGFLGRVSVVQAVAERLAHWSLPQVVVDPVLVNHRGEPMFAEAVVAAYREQLLPLASVLTPNRHEAALLLGETRLTWSLVSAERVARQLLALGPQAVVVKAIPDGDELVDVVVADSAMWRMRAPRIDTINTHGSGDTLSAALAAYLGQGQALDSAVAQAHQFTQNAIAISAEWRLGSGHGPLGHLPTPQ